MSRRLFLAAIAVLAAASFSGLPTAPVAASTSASVSPMETICAWPTFKFKYVWPAPYPDPGVYWVYIYPDGCTNYSRAYGVSMSSSPYGPSGYFNVGNDANFWANISLTHIGTVYPRAWLLVNGTWSCYDGGSPSQSYQGCWVM